MAITKVSSGLISADASSIDLNIDAGTLYLDVSENRVGIGTTSPDTLLNIASSSAPTLRIENTDGSLGLNQVIGAVEFYKTDTSGGGAGVAGAMQLLSTFSTGSKTSFTFSTSNADGNNVERLRIDDSGNLLVGTTSAILSASNRGNVTINGASDSILNLGIGGNQAGYLYHNGTALNLINTKNGELKFFTNDTEKMRIDSSGNCGIGTSSPLSKMTIAQTSGNTALTFQQTNNGTTNFLIGCQYNVGNAFEITPSTAAGGSTFSSPALVVNSSGKVGINEASPSKLLHITSNTNYEGILIKGAGHKQFQLESTQSSKQVLTTYKSNSRIYNIGIETDNAFIFQDGTASTERMRISSSGEVGIGGTAASGRNLHVHGIIRVENPHNSNYPVMEFFNTNGQVGGIRTSNSITSYDTSSDYRLKENVEPIPNGLARLQQLNPVKFDWKVDGTSSEGFIAHEVQEIFPDAVGGEKDGENMQSMDYGKITPLLVKAIQEQQTIINDLKTRIETLENV